MQTGEPIDARIPWVRRIHDLDEAWGTRAAGPRLRALRRAGERVGDALREGPRVVSVRTMNVAPLIYPTRFAFSNAVPIPYPYVVMTHRSLLVQVLADGLVKNVLFNPTNAATTLAAPYLRDTAAMVPAAVRDHLANRWPTVDRQLASMGVSPADIDVIAFDHFHTQDLRPLLGSTTPDADGARLAALYPNALLLAPRVEWEDWDDLHPLQRYWFVADGKRGVPEGRVVLTDSDLVLGAGCALLRTPGHTVGNQTLFVHADRGVFGCCENGTSCDSWAPYESRIPGLQRFARGYGLDVVLNSNTPERWTDQYDSMILELAIVDRVAEAPAFPQMFPSSEVTPSVLTPGLRPSVQFGERDSGTLRTTRERLESSASPQIHA